MRVYLNIYMYIHTQALVSLCFEDKHHTSEFIRKNGHIWIGKCISENLQKIDNTQISVKSNNDYSNVSTDSGTYVLISLSIGVFLYIYVCIVLPYIYMYI
jgi:hypothetical protein